MQIKGVKKLRDVRLDLSTLSPEAKQRLAARIGDIAIVDVQKRYQEKVGVAVAQAYSAYLLAVADYFGRKGDGAFRIEGGLGRYRRTVAGHGAVKRRVVPIPDRLPASTIQISFSVPVPTGMTGKSLLDGHREQEIAFSATFAGLAKSTIEKKLSKGVSRYWKQSGQTLRVVGTELRAIAKSNPAKVAVVSRRRIPIQPDFRPKASKPYAKYSLVLSIRLKAPRDPAWAELITESFASGVIRSGFGKKSAFGSTPVIRSIFNETGFMNRAGVAVPARSFIQEMGMRAGRALFQQLQQVNA